MRRHVDDASEGVAILTADHRVIYANTRWPSALVVFKGADPIVPDGYERATLLQGIQEVIEGRQKLFTRKCGVRLDGGVILKQLTVVRCRLAGGGFAAAVWCEKAVDKQAMLEPDSTPAGEAPASTGPGPSSPASPETERP